MLTFKLVHNDITYDFTLVIENDFIYHNRFIKLSQKSLIALKKNEIAPYSISILASADFLSLTFFLSSVILPTKQEQVIDELNQYLIDEEIIGKIEEKILNLKNIKIKPSWAN